MSQTTIGQGFRYPYDILTTLDPWRDKFGESFDRVVAVLTERDRALEDQFNIAPIFSQVILEESTTSTVPTDLSTPGPTVKIKLPRGSCVVTNGAFVTSTATGQTAYTEIFLDGLFLQTGVLLGNNAGGSLSASLSSTVLFEDLGVGEHLFETKYASSNGVEVRFDSRFLIVTPLK